MGEPALLGGPGPDPGVAAVGDDAARAGPSIAIIRGSGLGPGVWARISAPFLGSPKRLVPRIGGIMSQSLAVSAWLAPTWRM